MHRRLQFDMRENPASDRRHGSRLAVGSLLDSNCIGGKCLFAGSEASSHTAQCQGATDEKNRNTAKQTATTSSPKLSQKSDHPFEPLIDSSEAAKLLGNIHIKTLQRYARQRRLPGYQIGCHWYFRASELDSWLQSRINSTSPTR